METVRSPDGTAIAFDRTGSGPAVVLVGGAFSYRMYPGSVKLADLLSTRFTVFNYDRRGRGDSGDTSPYAVKRELEDLRAVMKAAGGSASVFGMSSGGMLALRAAAAGLNIRKLAMYQPPVIVDGSRTPPGSAFAIRLKVLLSEGKRSAAVRHFMTQGMGVPGFIVGVLRLTPAWSRLTAVAHTLPYDHAVMGDTISGAPLRSADWKGITAPALVVSGAKSQKSVQAAAAAVANALPAAQTQVLPGQSHDVSMEALAPVLAEFFGS